MTNLKINEYKDGRCFIAIIRSGADLLKSIHHWLDKEKIKTVTILSAVGSIKSVRLDNPMLGVNLPMTLGRFAVREFKGPLNVLSLSGIFVNSEHDGTGTENDFYITASNVNGEVIGGRLREASVFTSCEIILAELSLSRLKRRLCKTSGVATLTFAE